MNPSKGGFVVITRSAASFKKFYKGTLEQGCETRIAVLCDGDFEIPADSMRPGWIQTNKATVLNTGAIAGDDEWLGILFDDQVPQSPRWDLELASQCNPWEIITSIEAREGDWRKGAIVISRDILEAIGEIRLEEKGFNEDIARISATAISSSTWRPIMMQLPRHNDVGPFTPQPIVPQLAKKFKDVMAKHGVKIVEPDYAGMSLLISVPNISGKVETEFMCSVLSTMRELNDRKVPVEISFEQFNADIALARSHIVTEFLKTKHTHLLMIDDDMTWEPAALHRLVYANRPIVAVAGPKKSYPLRFACSKVDDEGKFLPITIDMDSGAANVNHVGAAFMLFQRVALEKMVEHYKDVAFVGSDGKKSVALFAPIVINDFYMAEDYAFCHRWRNIGGELFICPDVPLGHIGRHKYHGSLMRDQGKGAT